MTTIKSFGLKSNFLFGHIEFNNTHSIGIIFINVFWNKRTKAKGFGFSIPLVASIDFIF